MVIEMKLLKSKSNMGILLLYCWIERFAFYGNSPSFTLCFIGNTFFANKSVFTRLFIMNINKNTIQALILG
jgi:hypothetical protein